MDQSRSSELPLMLRENAALTAKRKDESAGAKKRKTQLITDVIKSMHNLKALAQLFLLHGSCDLSDTHGPLWPFYQAGRVGVGGPGGS